MKSKNLRIEGKTDKVGNINLLLKFGFLMLCVFILIFSTGPFVGAQETDEQDIRKLNDVESENVNLAIKNLRWLADVAGENAENSENSKKRKKYWKNIKKKFDEYADNIENYLKDGKLKCAPKLQEGGITYKRKRTRANGVFCIEGIVIGKTKCKEGTVVIDCDLVAPGGKKINESDVDGFANKSLLTQVLEHEKMHAILYNEAVVNAEKNLKDTGASEGTRKKNLKKAKEKAVDKESHAIVYNSHLELINAWIKIYEQKKKALVKAKKELEKAKTKSPEKAKKYLEKAKKYLENAKLDKESSELNTSELGKEIEKVEKDIEKVKKKIKKLKEQKDSASRSKQKACHSYMATYNNLSDQFPQEFLSKVKNENIYLYIIRDTGYTLEGLEFDKDGKLEGFTFSAIYIVDELFVEENISYAPTMTLTISEDTLTRIILSGDPVKEFANAYNNGEIIFSSVGIYLAVDRGIITPQFTSTGKASGHVADLIITSNAPEPITIDLKNSGLEGLILINPNKDEQDLVITRIPGVSTGPTAYRPADNVTINPNESVTLPVIGSCANMSKKNPSEGLNLTLNGLISGDVPDVIEALRNTEFPENFTQGDIQLITQITIWMSQPENKDKTPEDYEIRGYPIKEEYKPIIKDILNETGTNTEDLVALTGKKKEEKPPEEPGIPEIPTDSIPWIYIAAAVGILAIMGIYKMLKK